MTRPVIAPSDAAALNAMLMAVRQGADVVCDRWSLALIISALLGDSRFAEFVRRTGLASRLATMRLRTLVEQGLMVRLPYSIRPLRHEYRLTNMGLAFRDVVHQMVRWERNWNGETMPAPLAAQLCGSNLEREMRCASCGAVVTARDITLKISRADLAQKPVKQALHRRSIISGSPAGAGLQHFSESLDAFGDKWGIEILVCAFTGIRRFNDFRSCTDISANILSDRLARFVESGILRQAAGAGAQGYRLTPKGMDTYGVLVALQDWSDGWLSQRYRSPVKLIHEKCGHLFHLAGPAVADKVVSTGS
jgi:DNA-binding HxlR family transcriptional regulator